MTGCYGQYGPAVMVGEGMPVELSNCIFSENVATTDGGAIGNAGGWPTITGCLFLNNVAARGGAIDTSWGEFEMSSCSFIGNQAESGGALLLDHTIGATISRCTFVANEATTGSSICVLEAGPTPVTINNTIVALGSGGEGLYWDGQGALNLSHDDIYGNAGGDWVGLIADQFGQTGNVSLDPLFCDPDALDFTLMEGSPCLRTGNPDQEIIGAHGLGCENTSAVFDDLSGPAAPPVLRNYPNPFNPRTTIVFHVDRSGPVDVAIFDLTGRRVTVLANRVFTAGEHALEWQGRDAVGGEVASGAYMVRLTTDRQAWNRTILLVR